MHRRLAAGLAVVVFVTLVTGAFFAAPTSGTEQPESPDVATQLGDIDRTVIAITVNESGDARWAVRIQQDISSVDSDRIEQFNTFADRFNAEETETFENFQLRAERLTQSGTNVTGREMTATDFQKDAYYDDSRQKGVVEMSFRWEGFAQVRDERVIVSGVFDGGFAILDDQRLEIFRGENLRFGTVEPEPDRLALDGNQTGSEWVRWRGPAEFETGDLNVTLAPPGTAPVTDQTGSEDIDGSPDDQADGSPDTQDGGSGLMLPLFVAAILLVGAGSGAIWYVSTREQTETVPARSPDIQQDTAESTGEDISVSQEELLSDEDRVVKLLEENGGRMRQVSIVEETEWSKSKVSMLLSDMEDGGEISKLRVGRENIISLSGEEPDAAGSPFENEGE